MLDIETLRSLLARVEAAEGCFKAMLAASPYRATTLIDDAPDDEFTRDASAENVTAGK